MPNHCCVPDCRSNYNSIKGEHVITTFKFPKEETLKNKWISVIRRPDFTPSSSSVVCIKHFDDDDIIRYHTSNGKIITESPLKYLKIKTDAFPRIFTHFPSYLIPPKRKERTGVEDRQIKRIKNYENEIQKFFEEDKINSFEDLITNLTKKIKLSEWNTNIKNNKLYIYLLEINDTLKVKSYVEISSELQSLVYVNDVKLNYNDLKWVFNNTKLVLEKWSQLENLLVSCKNENKLAAKPIEYYLEKSLEYLYEAQEVMNDDFKHEKTLELVTDQVKLMMSSKITYCHQSIITAFVIYSHSSSTYEFLRQFFILPHKRYLQFISSKLSISPDSDDNTQHYLKIMAKNLNEREKVVNLMIDEIYVTSKLVYKAQKIDGMAENKPDELAKTIQSFMITSPFGHFKEMVRLCQVSNQNANELSTDTRDVINFLQNCGFRVLTIITDNNRINQNLFKILSGSQKDCFKNPKYEGEQIFLMFDPVHIFKNIRNNWINLKNYDHSFIYPNFITGETRKASFEHLRSKYFEESNLPIKKAFKLNYNSLYPNNMERQRVNYVCNIFHPSTIATLNYSEDTVETAEFLQIICNWWSIFNTKSQFIQQLTKNDFSGPFESTDDFRVQYLQDFLDWLLKWKNIPNNNGVLTTDTFNAIYSTTNCFLKILNYSFHFYNFENAPLRLVLPGKFQTDDLEKRFGKYRRLAGCNYHVSVTEVKESEKKIRIHHILEQTNKNNSSLKDLEKNIEEKENIKDVESFMCIFESDYLAKCIIDDEAKMHYSGYCAYSISKKIKCIICKTLIVKSKGDTSDLPYFDHMQRGGLIIPTDEVMYVLFHMTAIFQHIINNEHLKSKFLLNNNQKNVLVETTMKSLHYNVVNIDFDYHCNQCKLSGEKIFEMLCSPMANKILDNFTRNINDKKKSEGNSKRKILKYNKSSESKSIKI